MKCKTEIDDIMNSYLCIRSQEMIHKEIHYILSLSLSLTFLHSCSICSVIICVYINYEQSKCIRKHLNKLQLLIKSKILLNSSYPAALTLNVRTYNIVCIRISVHTFLCLACARAPSSCFSRFCNSFTLRGPRSSPSKCLNQ